MASAYKVVSEIIKRVRKHIKKDVVKKVTEEVPRRKGRISIPQEPLGSGGCPECGTRHPPDHPHLLYPSLKKRR
jgi:hypothetical protein